MPLKEPHAVYAQIVNCRKCPLRESPAVRFPVPWRGKFPNPLMVIGEAPGKQENDTGQPFIGPSGKLVDRLMREAGLPDLSEWFVANSVCCRSIGPPQRDSITACRDNLREQVYLADPEWVLLLGSTALQASACTKEKITKLHGRPFYGMVGPLIGRWIFPTFHPAAGLRDEARLKDLADDLGTLSRVLQGQIDVKTIECKIGRNGKMVA